MSLIDHLEGQDALLFRDFEAFYSAYPRKVGKRAAWLKYKQMRHTYTQAEILGGLQRWLVYWQEKRTELHYIPHPATWLHQGRCEDAPPQPRAAGPASLNDVLGL